MSSVQWHSWRVKFKKGQSKKRKGPATTTSAEREKALEVLITGRLSSFLSVWLLASLAGRCACQWGEWGEASDRRLGFKEVWKLFYWRKSEQLAEIVAASLLSAGASCMKTKMMFFLKLNVRSKPENFLRSKSLGCLKLCKCTNQQTFPLNISIIVDVLILCLVCAAPPWNASITAWKRRTFMTIGKVKHFEMK